MSEGANAQGANAPASGQNSNAQGANANGANQNQNQNSEYVSKADYDSLVEKLDAVIADNVKYRQDRRENRSGTNKGNNNGDSSSSGNEEVTALKTQLRTANFRADITRAAEKAGAIMSDQLYKLLSIDDYADELGNVDKPDKVMEKLKKDNPDWFKPLSDPPNINAGAGGGGANSTDMNALIRQAAHRSRVG